MQKILLFGNGQVASATLVALQDVGKYEIVALTVDRAYIQESEIFGRPVVPFETVEQLYPPEEYQLFLSISFRNVNRLRAEKFAQARAKGYRMISPLHSTALIASNVTLGENVSVGANSLISPFAQIGDDVMIGPGCLIGHHTVLRDHCWLAGNVSVGGDVTVGERTFVGLNATIRDRVRIASGCVIGAGGVLLADTAEDEVFLAVPSERLPISSRELPMG